MRRHLSIIALLSLVAGVYAGCSKDYITNNITENPGETGIIGRVTPGEPGITVSAWQAVKLKEVAADDSGYYAILGLTTGLYEVRAISPTGQTVIQQNVRVVKGSASTVNIRLDAPSGSALIAGVDPRDGSTRVRPMGSRISLNALEPLDVASLASAVVIAPPVAGQWSSDYIIGPIFAPSSDDIVRASSAASYYTFRPDSQFLPATIYTVQIGPTLRLADGRTWGDSLTFSFTTDSLRVLCFSVNSGRCGDTIVPLRPFQVQLQFNSAVNIDSVNAAAFFTPDFEGFWYYADSYYGETRTDIIKFFFTEPAMLRADQAYTLTLTGSVGLAGPVGLGPNFVATMVTEPVRVVRILPAKGADAAVTTWVEVEFSTGMDHPTTEAAVSVHIFGGSAVAGSKVWLNEYKLTFRPDAPLMLGQAYEALVATTAVSLAGDTLRDSAYSFFRAAY